MAPAVPTLKDRDRGMLQPAEGERESERERERERDHTAIINNTLLHHKYAAAARFRVV